jgi:hypothetical protein
MDRIRVYAELAAELERYRDLSVAPLWSCL